MPQKVAILGCGPAGLLAAHAAKLMGHSITIFSKKQHSEMRGAQYMHRNIPELNLNNPVKLAYVLHGDIDAYRAKVYGDNVHDDVVVSPELFQGFHQAWDIRQAYRALWTMYNHQILDTKIDNEFVQKILNVYDVVISSIPAPTLCYQNHVFNSVKVWIDETWCGGEVGLNKQRYGSNHVVLCNGIPYDPRHPRQTGWYRTSLIYNRANTEWASKSDTIPIDAKRVLKPTSTNCNCWSSIVKTGRYGIWQKGVLSHESFELMLEVLA